MLTLTNIDPKYAISADGPARIVKVTNPTEAIPTDEPLILFRARDRHALAMLRYYRELCIADQCTDFHLDGINNRIEAFEVFSIAHPRRMKQPGITRGL